MLHDRCEEINRRERAKASRHYHKLRKSARAGLGVVRVTEADSRPIHEMGTNYRIQEAYSRPIYEMGTNYNKQSAVHNTGIAVTPSPLPSVARSSDTENLYFRELNDLIDQKEKAKLAYNNARSVCLADEGTGLSKFISQFKSETQEQCLKGRKHRQDLISAEMGLNKANYRLGQF